MHVKLESDANDGLHFLCDRSLAPYDLEKLAWNQKKPWKALVKSGALLSFQASGGGGCWAELFVDEEPPAELRKRGKKLAKGALLRVPSGELRNCGGTCWDTGQSSDGLSAETVVTVLAGSYSVEALDTVYSGDDESAMHKEIERRMGEKAYRRHQLVGKVGCNIMTVAAFVGLLGSGVGWALWGWKGVIGLLVAVVLVIVVVFKAMDSERLAPGHNEFLKHWKDLHKQDAYPDLVLVLRRLPSDADLSVMKGASLVGPEL